jgi:hypothetical protein
MTTRVATDLQDVLCVNAVQDPYTEIELDEARERYESNVDIGGQVQGEEVILPDSEAHSAASAVRSALKVDQRRGSLLCL